MFLQLKLYELPLEFDGVRFQFDNSHEYARVYEIDTQHSLSPGALVYGKTLVRSVADDGAVATVLSNDADILVDVKGGPNEGITVGGILVVTADEAASAEDWWLDMSALEMFNIARDFFP